MFVYMKVDHFHPERSYSRIIPEADNNGKSKIEAVEECIAIAHHGFTMGELSIPIQTDIKHCVSTTYQQNDLETMWTCDEKSGGQLTKSTIITML